MGSEEQVSKVEAVAHFETYEDYLDTLVTWQDMFYLEDEALARAVVELGYRGSAEFLRRHEFLEKRREFKASKEGRDRKQHQLSSEGLKPEEPLMQALADREAANREGRLATVIFLRDLNERNQEISGYIDYLHRLRTDNFRQYFLGEARLLPRITDIAYFNWKTQHARCNNSPNWQVISESPSGLLFKSRQDRKLMTVDLCAKTPGDSSTRTLVSSPQYTQVVLYDHVIRQRI